MTRAGRRKGVALFAAIALMALIGLMIGGALASSRLAQRSARLSQADAVLTASAELGLNTLLSQAAARGLADLPLGRAESYENVSRDLGVNVTVVATRLGHGLVWLVSEARLVTTNAPRRINLIARWPSPGAPPPAPVVARGSVRIASGVIVSTDTSGEADCRSAAAPLVVVAPGAVATGGGLDTLRVSIQDLANDSSTYYLRRWQRALLDSASNVVRVTGDTTITDGTFDGVLLVGGNLTILGLLSARGLIIARGVINVGVGSINLTGAMLSFATPPTGVFAIDVGQGLIRYSPCAISNTWRRSLSLRPVGHRSWSELF